ncbi:hypothetical protein CBER1_07099 [Cercospora berteroae]|uniref:Carotenoid oxygenase n=1 Tax=Cercospora berteroae TaxID=357750 RepID=A0A2S6BTS4_9PEZI|nr:hypothetical protein CBER1_07099 [Cercospora berteroae]
MSTTTVATIETGSNRAEDLIKSAVAAVESVAHGGDFDAKYDDGVKPSMENRFGLKSSWDHFLPSPADMPQGRFECELDEVIVYGEIPKTIDGTWYRMLNDPHFPPAKGTPFVEGDGHLCAFRIQDGKISMKTRYVQTERWLLERKAGRRLFGMYRNPYDAHCIVQLANDATCNTNIIYWGGNLLALAERGLPYAMDPDTLETRGADSFAGQTRAKTFAAHPKVDPFKNELVTWSYNAKGLATRDFATFSISEDGVVSNENWYQQDKTGWPHDGWITENWIILANMPFTTNSEEVLKQGGHYWTFVDDQPQEFLVAPRTSGAPRHPSWKVGEFRKYVTDHGLIVHAGNAWEAEDGTLQLESHFLSFNVFPFWNPPGYKPPLPKANWVRYTIDLSQPDGTKVAPPVILQEGIYDFPVWDERFTTKPTKYVIMAEFANKFENRRPDFDHIVRLNTETGEKQVFHAGDESYVLEPAFIPRSADAPEGDGYIIFYTTRASTNKGELVILDTEDMSKPLAIAVLPFAMRKQVHGNWVDNPHPGKKLPLLTAPVKQDVRPTPWHSQLHMVS